MKNVSAILLSLSFASLILTAEEAERPLPKEMEPIVAELNSAKADAIVKAIKKLQKVQVDLTKKGDLDGAMAAKKYIENLQTSVEKDGADTGNPSKVVIGTWTRNLKNRNYTFNEDGTFTQSGVESNNGKWTMTKGQVILTATEGSVTTLTIKSATEMVGSMSDGTMVIFVRK